MRARLRRCIALMLAAWLGAFASPGAADELRPGYLEFTQRDANMWTLAVKTPLAVRARGQGEPVLPPKCRALGAAQRDTVDAALIARYQVRCSGNVTGSRIGLASLGPGRSEVLVRVAPLGRPVQALRLTAANPTAQIEAKPRFWQVARSYFAAGVEHILLGYDHLLFVIALVLLLGRPWPVTKAVTAFTVAHSLTLVGTTLGLLGLPQAPVEALIALSIVFLAVEIVKRSPGRKALAERAPWIVAFLFGLLHGFGFAGALREIGLPEGEVPAALVAFNLGVEAGQLLIVLACLGVLGLLRKVSAGAVLPATRATTYAIGMVASYWLIERLV